MSLDYINSKKIRKSFGKIPLVTSLPNLVEVQKRSYDNFLQLSSKPPNIIISELIKSSLADFSLKNSGFITKFLLFLEISPRLAD